MSKCQTQSTNSHGHVSKFALSTPVSNSYEPVTKSENEEIFLEDIYSNCDKLQPVSISLNEDFNSDKNRQYNNRSFESNIIIIIRTRTTNSKQ